MYMSFETIPPDRYQCLGCQITVICDAVPSNHAIGEMRQQVSDRLCTSCYRRQNPGRSPQ